MFNRPTAGSVPLTRQIDFAGKSGSVYRYSALEEERSLPPVGANYVIAQLSPTGASILFAGETECLSARDWQSILDEAQARYGVSEILTRLNVRGAVRKAEREDILAQHNPPMNAA